MIVEYFAENSPVAPETDNHWRITAVDLCTEYPRRAEIIGYINAGLLQCPYDRSYNLGDYDALAAEAEANRKEGKTFGAREDYH
jgi:2',3'-cyclic-nucleotide 2'-phosphodiesterase/3'-nucleotidase